VTFALDEAEIAADAGIVVAADDVAVIVDAESAGRAAAALGGIDDVAVAAVIIEKTVLRAGEVTEVVVLSDDQA